MNRKARKTDTEGNGANKRIDKQVEMQQAKKHRGAKERERNKHPEQKDSQPWTLPKKLMNASNDADGSNYIPQPQSKA